MARFETRADYPNLTVLRIQFPSWRWPDAGYVDAERRRLVREFLSGPGAGQFEKPVQWFYDPMAVRAFAGHLGEIAIVYDCMDELSRFRFAPPELLDREKELLEKADVVFTGGLRLYESKKRLNPNCHFQGCGVDVPHFSRARDPQTPVPEDLRALRQPILGYFGVVDERLDYELIAKLADANPAWSVVMVGPRLKVDAEHLPQRPNLHWLGGKPYAQLPAYCKAFAVCLMPFALNESTEFINPTKALEYMAAGRPVVSSAVPDVLSNFGSIAKIAQSHDAFIALCRDALARPDQGAIDRGLKLASRNSWESVVARLEREIEEALSNPSTIQAFA